MELGKKSWTFVSIFMAVLVVSLPFYTANVFAATVTIKENHGKDGVKGFAADSSDEIWTVIASIEGASYSFNENNVSLKVGSNELGFTKCEDIASGKDCTSIYEGRLAGSGESLSFNVELKNSTGVEGSASGELKIDGEGPKIVINSVKQDGSEIVLDLKVTDQPNSCVGLDKVEVLYNDSVVKSENINVDAGNCSAWGSEVKLSNSDLKLGEFYGGISLVVKGYDKLGNSVRKAAPITVVDLKKPVIITESFYSSVGNYTSAVIPKGSVFGINVKEDSNFNASAKISGNDIGEGDCSEKVGFYSCVWMLTDDVGVSGSYTFDVDVEDEFGNKGSASISKDAIADNTAPEITFFGRPDTYEGKSFVRKDSSVEIAAMIKEEGSGINKNDVEGDFASLNDKYSGKVVLPGGCVDEDGMWKCSWFADISKGVGPYTIEITSLKDNVGNAANLGSGGKSILFLDEDAPVVEKVKLTGVNDELGRHDFFQSKDIIEVSVRAKERNGLRVGLDLSDLVDGADESYPEGVLWFKGEDASGCSYNSSERMWDCTFETPRVRSGTGDYAALGIIVRDAAGNTAKIENEKVTPSDSDVVRGCNYDSDSGMNVCKIKLLGLEEETDPDFYEVKKVTNMQDFIDIPVTGLLPTRFVHNVELERIDKVDVKVSRVDIVGCDAAYNNKTFEDYGGSMLLGNAFGASDPTISIMTQIEPFDGESFFNLNESRPGSLEDAPKVHLKCTLNIFSIRKNQGIKSPEEEVVEMDIPFWFTGLDSPGVSIDKLIEREKDKVRSGWGGFINTISDYLAWIQFTGSIVAILNTVIQTGMVIDAAISVPEDISRPVGGEAASTSGCYARGGFLGSMSTFAGYLQFPLDFLSCNGRNPVVGTYQDFLVKTYNTLSLRSAIPVAQLQVGDISSNFGLSILGLCLPGIINGIQRLNSIQCQYIECLETNVKAGMATVGACNKLKSMQKCKYVWGEVFALTPLALWDSALNLVKAMLTDPVALIRTGLKVGELMACDSPCPLSSGVSSTCRGLVITNNVLSILESAVSIYYSHDKVGKDYCDRIGL